MIRELRLSLSRRLVRLRFGPVAGLPRKHIGQHRRLRPNNSFKPNLLRYTNNMAGRACHVVASATKVGLTQVLEIGRESCRERLCQLVQIMVDAESLKTKNIITIRYISNKVK